MNVWYTFNFKWNDYMFCACLTFAISWLVVFISTSFERKKLVTTQILVMPQLHNRYLHMNN